MSFYILGRAYRHDVIKASDAKDLILLSEEKVSRNWSTDDPKLVESTVRKNNENIVDKSFRDSKTSTEEYKYTSSYYRNVAGSFKVGLGKKHVYLPGNFMKEHCDTRIAEDHVGTLILTDSIAELRLHGAAVNDIDSKIKHSEEEFRVNRNGLLGLERVYTLFIPLNMPHQVLPVEKTRVSFSFPLFGTVYAEGKKEGDTFDEWILKHIESKEFEELYVLDQQKRLYELICQVGSPKQIEWVEKYLNLDRQSEVNEEAEGPTFLFEVTFANGKKRVFEREISFDISPLISNIQVLTGTDALTAQLKLILDERKLNNAKAFQLPEEKIELPSIPEGMKTSVIKFALTGYYPFGELSLSLLTPRDYQLKEMFKKEGYAVFFSVIDQHDRAWTLDRISNEFVPVDSIEHDIFHIGSNFEYGDNPGTDTYYCISKGTWGFTCLKTV